MTSQTKTGADLLRGFLKEREIPLRDAAKGIKVSHPAIVQWLDGTAKPSAPHREAIDRWTLGEVPAESWLEQHEVDRLNTVSPWEPKPEEEAPTSPANDIPAASGAERG